MKIRFDVTIDDLIEFSVYFCEHSPTLRRTKTLFLWGVPLVLFAIQAIVVLSVLSDGVDELSLALALGACLCFTLFFTAFWIVRFPYRLRQTYGSRARKFYSEGSTAGMVGSQELELTETALVSRTSTGEAYIRISAIEKVITDEDYTYIFPNSFSAFVIPHDAITAGELTAFIESLERRITIDRA